jgi:ribokinase
MSGTSAGRRLRLVAVGGCGVGVRFAVPYVAEAGETVLASDVRVINGGKGANQAIGAAFLGADASIISAVGEDVFGSIVAGLWERHGVATSGVVVRPEASTMVGAVMVDSSGENHITLAPGALGRLSRDDVRDRRGLIEAADVCVVSLEIAWQAAAEALAIARAAGVLAILNPAPAPAPVAIDELLRLADWVTPNEVEAAALSEFAGASPEAAAERILGRGARGVVMTLGPGGALVADGSAMRRVPAPEVPPEQMVDTAGAGDAFNTAFALALAGGWSVDVATAIGCEAGALICRGPGFVEALDTWRGFAVPGMAR